MKIQLQKVSAFYLTLFFLLFFEKGLAQTVVTLGGGATVTCPASPTATWTTPPVGVTFSNWSRGSGVTCASASDGISGSVFNATSAAAGYTANCFYKVTITADATHNFTLSSIKWLATVSTNSANFTVKTVNNGGTATDFGTASQSGSGSSISLTFSGSVIVAAGTSVDVYLIPHQTNAPGTKVRFKNNSTFTVTASSSSGAPSISSPTATSISNTSAVLGANITSDGGSSITNRGTVFKTSSPVTISDNYLSEGGTSTGVFTHTRSSLTPQTLYYYAGYGTNSSGTTLSSESSFRTLSNPPTAQASNLAGVLTSNTAADLSWTAATFPSSGATSKGYVLLRATSPNTPSLSNTNGAAPVAGANTTIVSSTISELSLFQSSTGLTANTTYNYMLIPYTWDGTNVSTYNYLFASAPTAVVNTPSNLSDVVAVASSESVTISSLMNDAAPLTSSTGVQVWQFTVRDGGSTLNDTDNLPTVVTGFTLTQNTGNAIDNWLDAIKTIALFDGATLIATPTSITATTIVFSGLNLSVTDNSSKTFSLRLSLNETLNNIGSGNLDNDDFVFSITNANFSTITDGTSSTKASFTNASSTNGQNAVSVVASKLLFVQQPTNVSTNTSISPSVTVRAVDNGNNLDRDFVSSVSITATGSTLIGSPIAVNSVIGLATFSSLQFSTPATGVVLEANSTGLTGVVSSGFDVTLPLSAYSYRTIRSGNWNEITVGNETWERTSDGTNWFAVSSLGDIPNNSAGIITVREGHIVQVSSATNVDELLVEADAQITIQSAQTLTIIDGAGTDASISGYIKNDGTFINNGQIVFNASSTYEHSNNISSSSIPLATWDPTSNLLISGVVSNFPSFNSSQTYGNVIWNCTSQSGTLNLIGNLRNIAGNFIIQSTGTGILRLTGSTSATFTIGGNLEISNSSQLQVANAPSSGTPTYVLNIGGNFSQTGGIFNPNTGSYNCTINFTGNQKVFSQTGGTLTSNLINWNIINGAYLNLSSDLPVFTNRILTISGTLDCGSSNKITGSGGLSVSNGGTLKTSNLNATDAYAAAVGITGTATLAAGSTVELNGATQQFLGARTFYNLKINNISGVLAKGDITVNGILDLATANPNATNGTLEMVNDYTGYAQNPYGTGDYTNSTASFNNLDSYVLTMGPSATTVGIGDVTGKIRRTGLVDNTTYSFGNAHTELRLNSVSGSAIPSQITVVATRGAYGTHIDNTGGVAINGNTANRNAVQRLYQVLRTGGDVASRFTLRMAYEDTELNGNAEANLVSWDHHLPYGAITPHEHGKTSANATENWVELSNHSVNYLATEGATAFTKYWMLSAKESLNDYEWLGAVAVPGQTNWNITENWKSGKIPNEAANVFIPNAALTANDPVINSDSGYGILDGTSVTAGEVRMRSLEIASGGVLTVASGTAPTITLYGGPNVGGGGVNYGSWLNNGTFTAENSTVVFDFDTTATESTIAGSTTFNNLTIANGKKQRYKKMHK